MENTDIDMVTSIPDTPDREVRRDCISREVKRSLHSPEAPLRHRRDEYRSYLNGITRPVHEVGEGRGNSDAQTENARASGRNALFRRAAVEKDKGKSICTDPVRIEKNPVVNLNQRNGQAHVTAARCLPVEDVRELRLSNGCSPSRETIDLSSDKQNNRGTKRFVRYGCISPHAIAARAKQQAADTNSKDIVDVEQEISPETTSSIVAREIVSGNDVHGRARGKRPEICRSRMASRDAVGSEAEGWISTRHQKLNIDHETNRRNETDTHGICSSVSRLEVHETGAVEGEARQQQRRRKINFTTLRASDEPEVTVIGGEPSSSRPPRIHNRQRRHGTQVLEIDDSSPDVRVSRVPRRAENDDSHVKVRQIEADEILARELQEQLYQEATLRDEQIDENIARLLEQEENALRASSSRSSTRNSRSSSTVTANTGRRSRLEARLQQHSSRRRLNPPQTRAAVRAPTRGRGQRVGRIPTSHLSFPNDMNIEERLNILEGIENAMNHSNLLRVDRDFTEDDYELLLALDENNHRHGGASTHRINNLPESTVQTDNFQEACVICLETPTIGDTIRHLPCLHKFHKDCIDPWLGRSKSCPVCKSSVT